MKNHNAVMMGTMDGTVVLAILLASIGLDRLLPLVLLLCPLSMILTMWFMGKNSHKH